MHIEGLKNAMFLNGQEAVLLKYDKNNTRWIVRDSDGTLKRIKTSHLVPEPVFVPASKTTQAPPAAAAAAPQALRPRLSVCNAYPQKVAMEIFCISKDGAQYRQVVKNLPFQSCADTEDVPYTDGVLSFVVGRLQVARFSLNGTRLDGSHAVELVVHRPDHNSLKGAVRKSELDLDDKKAYWMHLVNTYSGSRLLEMHVERGSFKERVPLEKTFRLARAEPITLHLSDGYQTLQLGFEPAKSRNYFIITTGVDAGLQGEPFNIGMVAHEVGAWTASEEMTGQGAPPPPTGPPVLNLDNGDEEDGDGTAKKGVFSLLTHFASSIW